MNHPVLQVLALGKLDESACADRSDGELLDRFIRVRDEDAFAAVVRRHGPMVLAVCRRVLGNHADADDAFQATFLVLVRKAGALGSRRPLGPWLHGVAFNTARRLQRAGRRRAAYERSVADLPDVAADEPVNLSDELLKMLDEELTRLPARYRAPIVLCDLEGQTRRQAAARLGCPEGTVAGRLARARALLAARLASRGLVPSAGVLAALLTQNAAGALHPERVASAVKAAIGGPVSVRVSSLVERVVTAMFLQKVKSFVAVLLVLGGLLAVAGMGLRNVASADFESAVRPDNKAAAPSGDKLLTVIPLRKLDAAETATVLSDAFRGKGVIVAPIPDERSLLLYADAKTTREVQALLVKLGDSSGKAASRLKLDKSTDCRDAARVLTEVFNGPKAGATARVTVVPVSDENALLVYATQADMRTIRSLMKVLDEPAPAARGGFEDAPEAKKYTFGFRDTPWAQVLDWYAGESGLALVSTVKPTGNVTIMPPKERKFTFGEITDLINESLMAQKFILVRGETTFFLHPADEKIDPAKVPRIELSELKKRGKTELVQVVIPIPADAAQNLVPEIRLLSPFGSATRVKDSLVILDTVGNVTLIHEVLQKLNADKKDTDARESAIGNSDGGRFGTLIESQPELRKYNVLPGTADALAKVLQKEMPSLRIIAVRQTNQLMVLAKPNEHSALAAKFSEFIVDGNDANSDTILLSQSDESMIDKLRKLFPNTMIKPGEVNMPSIYVQGTPEQIKAVRDAIAVIEGRVKKE